ncbi:hypothetical protein Tco_1404245 [Tanacetum coccineum]
MILLKSSNIIIINNTRVPGVPTYNSDDEQISWKSSDEDNDDEVHVSEDDDNQNDDDADNEDDYNQNDNDADNEDDDDQNDDNADNEGDDDQDDDNEQTKSDNDDDDLYNCLVRIKMPGQIKDHIREEIKGAEPPKPRKGQKKLDSAISFEDTPSKKNFAKAKKDAATKPKPSKKKAPVKIIFMSSQRYKSNPKVKDHDIIFTR